MPRGFVAFHGPSELDGKPIIVVATAQSNNFKTGRAWQTWVLRADVAPFDALKTGDDVSICGNCRHRPNAEGRTCYVSLFTGPLGIYKAWERGAYPVVPLEEAASKLDSGFVRVSAYGDPAAVHYEWWNTLLARTNGWVGYTHQWQTCDQRFQKLLMASVDTPDERRHAEAIGWRTFRARPIGALVERGEFQCPASEESGHRTTCDKCRLCRGTSSPAKSVTIELHGRKFKAKSGQAMSDTRSVLAVIRKRIDAGLVAPFGPSTYREFQRAIFALKMFDRRHNRPSGFIARFDSKTRRGLIQRKNANL